MFRHLDREIGVKSPTATAQSQHTCPLCQALVHRRKSPEGYFWGCSGFIDGCGVVVPDVEGEPDFESLSCKAD